MSESKAEYYAKHLEELVEGVPGIPSEPRPVETVQPTGLPTLLAQMVNEYHGALKLNGYSGFPDRLVEGFSQMLLASAQPLLTEYLTAITTPPMMVVRETWTPPQPGLDDYRKYAEKCKKLSIPALWYDEWRKSLGAK